jgi:pimeloyl-ACP methyl ester carboxylesterase
MRQSRDLFHFWKAAMQDRVYSRPDRRLVFAEGPRAISEIASLVSMAPFLAGAPRSDGHGVLVLPGMGGSDRSTAVLRGYLNSVGARAQPWNLGTNVGPQMPDLLTALAGRLGEVHAASGAAPVSLVGWSLGGIYARLLAQLYPDMVRQVITLGSPFAGNPRSTRAYGVARRMGAVPRSEDLRLLAGDPLPNVPSTAIYSRTDGIVPWQIATQTPSDIAENIEVYASHLGMGFNPSVLYAVADRLATNPSEWRAFRRTGWKRFAYGPARLEDRETTGERHTATGQGA